MIEEWKEIPGYETYEISNRGEVRNSKKKTMYLGSDKNGYKVVGVCINGKRKNLRVHRLVAESFLPNVDNKETVDHINGIKTDNRVENLQWLTATENLKKYHLDCGHKFHNTKKRKTGMKRGEAKRIPILQCGKDGNTIRAFKSLMDAERETGIGSGRISLCINGIKKTAGGYIWKKQQSC